MPQNYTEYMASPEWYRRRQAKLSSASHKCEKCHQEDPRLEVHHLNYDRLGSELDTDLQVLCQSCHEQQHLPGPWMSAWSGVAAPMLAGQLTDGIHEVVVSSCEVKDNRMIVRFADAQGRAGRMCWSMEGDKAQHHAAGQLKVAGALHWDPMKCAELMNGRRLKLSWTNNEMGGSGLILGPA